MRVQSVAKYLRISPEKAREVGRLIQGRPVPEALAMVALIPRKAARCFERALKSAVANAENNLNAKRELLTVAEATVAPGPIIRRFQPKARGMAGRIRKRTSHFTVVVTDEL